MLINIIDFYNKLSKEDIFENQLFDLPEQSLNVQTIKFAYIRFENCTFNCKQLTFSNINDLQLVLEFKNCTFNCNLAFSNCVFDQLLFNNTKALKSLKITKGLHGKNMSQLNYFQFSNDVDSEEIKLNSDFHISNTEFKEIFSFDNIIHFAGRFRFINNRLGDKERNTGEFTFNYSTLSNALFNQNNFNELTTFQNTAFNYSTEHLNSNNKLTSFKNNSFQKVDFSNSNFFGNCKFENCDFLHTTLFEECKNLHNSKLTFLSCRFEKYSLFDNSKFDKIEILHCKFLEKASFDNFETNDFKIHQVTFAGAAYFDDLNKNNRLIEKWDRKTLRAIKRELVNSHNQIDYLRFKAYELKAYKKEVDESNLKWKDSLILYLGEESNNFGLDWTKGISFIFKWSIFFYANYIAWYAFYVNDINCNPTMEEFLVNYLKFVNPFSFLKSPIEDAENYFLPFLFFMLGKIFVSYGIYQTIQAFRKFGVNGG